MTYGLRDALGIQCLILTAIQLYSHGRSALTCLPTAEKPQEDTESTGSDGEDNQLLDAKHAALLLATSYPYLMPSFLKARVAFVLALLKQEDGQNEIAEQLIFESCYILGTFPENLVGFSCDQPDFLRVWIFFFCLFCFDVLFRELVN